MRRLICVSLLCCLPVGTAVASDLGSMKAESKAIVQAFMGQLKGELQSAMQQGGPVNAIQACNRVAPAVAEQQQQQHGWQKVARTSLKLRNPDNAPDAWERKVLEQFESRKAAGEAVEPMAFGEVVEENGRQMFRFMKAIPTGEVCLKCHGSDLAEPVAAKLDELYPQDAARGFALGDIRGAFSLKKAL